MDYLETVSYYIMLYIGKLAKIRLVMRFLYTNDFIRSCTDTLFKTKIDEIDTPFKTKPSKNHTLSGRTSPLRPYKGVPPPGVSEKFQLLWLALLRFYCNWNFKLL